jgi:hypothetical protein
MENALQKLKKGWELARSDSEFPPSIFPLPFSSPRDTIEAFLAEL